MRRSSILAALLALLAAAPALAQRANCHRGASFDFHLQDDRVAAIRDLSRREGVTLFMTLLAVFQALLQRYGGQDRISLGRLAPAFRRRLRPLLLFALPDQPYLQAWIVPSRQANIAAKGTEHHAGQLDGLIPHARACEAHRRGEGP